MNRGLVSTAACLAVVMGALLSVQQVVTADPALVIKNDGTCGMPGSNAEGEIIFGGEGLRTTQIENDNKVMLKCKGAALTNLSGQAQVFENFGCGIETEDGTKQAEDSHATVSAKGVGTMTCTFDK